MYTQYTLINLLPTKKKKNTTWLILFTMNYIAFYEPIKIFYNTNKNEY